MQCKAKKLIGILVSLLIITGIFSVLAVSADAAPVYSVSLAEGAPGENVTVDVSLGNGQNVAGGSFVITFDSEKLSAVSYSFADGISNPDNSFCNLNYEKTGNKVKVTYFSDSALQSGKIVSITFLVNAEAAPGSAALEFSATNAFDEQSAALSCSGTNGSVTIGNAFILGDVNGDGMVDSDDAIYLLNYAMADVETRDRDFPMNQSGDKNGDGMVDSDDAIYLLNYAMADPETRDNDYPLH